MATPIVIQSSGRSNVFTQPKGREISINKVADEAGIHVGSLYQYYPNKAAVPFHLSVAEDVSSHMREPERLHK